MSWALCLLCLSAAAARADDGSTPLLPQPRQLSVFDGLPSNRVNGVAEDQQGYLWIATRDGLARYAGVGFRIWRVGDGLRDNFVWSVHVDARDRIWVGTASSGLAMLDVDRGGFTWYDRATRPEMASDDVWSINGTPDGAIWFGTADGGLYRLSPDDRLQRFQHDAADPRSLPSDGVSHLVVGRDDGTLWVGTKAGVARWTGDGFERLPADRLGTMMVDGMTMDAEGNLWVGVHGSGVVRRPDGRIEPMPWIEPGLGVPALHMLLKDSLGTRWLDTRSGLAWVHEGRVDDVPLYSTTSRGPVRPAWAAGYEDREGGLWFASSDSGLWHLPANWRNFSVLQRRMTDPSSPGNAFVFGAAPSSAGGGGGLWMVGSGGMLDHLDPRTGNVEHRLTEVCGSLFVTGVIETSDGRVWLGCQDQLVRFDPASGRVRRWHADGSADAAPPGRIFQFVEQRDGTLWLASHQSIQVRDARGRVIDTIHRGEPGGPAPGAQVEHMMRAPAGGVWLATTGGLLAWNDGARSFDPVPGAPDMALHSIAVGPGGEIWLAGHGDLRAYAWDGARLSLVRTAGAEDGVPVVSPGGMVVDDTGVIWLTTVRGLVRFDPESRRLRVYGVHDGLPSHEFSEFPVTASAQGYVAAGTADGLLLFHPRKVQWSGRMPTLAIESVGLRRGDERVEFPPHGRLTLRHDDRDLRVTARLRSFTDAHAHRYRFLLHGYDPDWVETGASGERVLARLAPGHYRLDVQARTADDEWGAVESLQLSVEPPWWQAAWAVALFAAVGALLVLWMVHLYRQRLRRRHSWQLTEQRRRLAEQASFAKTRFLATLGHEVRTPMTGVMGMSELLLGTDLDPRQRHYADGIRGAGEHLMRLVNDALDLARIEAGELELVEEAFNLATVLEDVGALMEPVARQRGLRFLSHIDAQTPRWLRGDPGRVRQILLNLLGNAVKFTEAGSVSMQAAPIATGGVRLVVSDTGPGLSDEQQALLFRRFQQADGAHTAARYGGSGLGLAICKELATAMGGRIELDSTPGQGTDFTVDLPLPAASPVDVQAQQAPVAAEAAGPGLSLLLVEDDATVAEVISGLLAAQGHEVVHVPHGLAALSEVTAAHYDMALLDLDLPGITGLALAMQLRARGFDAPLLAVTARADAEAEPLAREAGFDGFLRKPVTGAMLCAAIDALRPKVAA
ncbi:MAG: response regulator [Gammaproteobacteria bacterium]|nr:response regulator [Gammaproteobacteria bacterium]